MAPGPQWVGVVSEYFSSLDPQAKARYIEKLRKYDVTEDPLLPRASSEDGSSAWKRNANSWPHVTYADIYNYLIDSISPFSKESLKAYKGLEAYKYLVAGYVRDVEAKSLSRDKANFVVRAKVSHGQKQNAPPLQPWLIIQQDGQVHTAHCTCMAGLGEACSHIAAVMFYLMASWDVIKGTSGTSLPCSWLAPGTKCKGRTLSETDFTSPQAKFNKGKKPRSTADDPGPGPADDKKGSFLQELQMACPSAAILKIWPGYAEPVPDYPLPMDMASLFDSDLVGMPIAALTQKACEVLDTLVCSEEERDNAQKITVQQTQCSEWFRLRAGRVTASNLQKVLSTDPTAPAPSVLASVCSSTQRSLRTSAVQWGKSKEQSGLEQYSDAQAQDHSNFKLHRSGLWVSCEVPYMAGSPDGLVECGCCGRGIVEVKCPFKFRDSTLAEYLADSKTCMSADENGVPRLKSNHQYFYQIQAQMFVCSVPFCDFVVHANTFTVIQRVMYDNGFMMDCLPRIKAFMTKCSPTTADGTPLHRCSVNLVSPVMPMLVRVYI